MSYIYPTPEDLTKEGKNQLIDNHQCVRLVQIKAGTPHTSLWKQGDKVRGNLSIVPGTAIATFVNGRYPNLPHGNHAALYVGQDGLGIWVVDQWKSERKKEILKRLINFRGVDSRGNPVTPLSDNGDAFFVVE